MDVSELAAVAWTTIQPIIPIIATKGAEEIGKRAVGEVWDYIKKKFDTKETAKEVLEDLLKDPINPVVQNAFQYQLQKFLHEDNNFALSLHHLIVEISKKEIKAQNIGNGAMALGNNNKATGTSSVIVEGNVSGDVVTGEYKKTI